MNVKAGDIALVIRGLNVGHVVVVEHYLGMLPQPFGDAIWYPDNGESSHAWVVSCSSTLVAEDYECSEVREYHSIPIEDSVLRRLNKPNCPGDIVSTEGVLHNPCHAYAQ